MNATLQRAADTGALIERNASWVRDVQQLLDDHHERIEGVYALVDEAHTGVTSVEERVRDFNAEVEALKVRADAIGVFNQQSIGEDIDNGGPVSKCGPIGGDLPPPKRKQCGSSTTVISYQ